MNQYKYKIVAIQGSYRENGVTTSMLRYATDKLSQRGHQVTYINLFEKKIDFCTWAGDVSVENCPKASVLNELMFFSEFSTARLEPSESVFSEEMSSSQVIKNVHA